jgi:drug/metabolite transporter (DMT)-like permease
MAQRLMVKLSTKLSVNIYACARRQHPKAHRSINKVKSKMVFDQWSKLSNQTRGTIYCVSAILILTPDSLCMRLLSNIPDFAVIFYRYILFASIYIVVYVAKEGKNTWNSFKSIGWIGALAGIVWGVSNFAITYAFQTTAIANALVINSANPMWSALFSWIVLKEKIPLRTLITSLVAFAAIVIIFYGQLGTGGGGVVGLISALIASMFMGGYFVLLRLAAGPKG